MTRNGCRSLVICVAIGLLFCLTAAVIIYAWW